MPSTTRKLASVTMNGCGTRPKKYTVPLTSPTRSPVPSMARITRAPESTCWYTIAPTTDESASVDWTERSIPRVTITSSWPRARTETTDDCCRTLPMFLVVKKFSTPRLTATTSSSRISAGPSRSSPRPT